MIKLQEHLFPMKLIVIKLHDCIKSIILICKLETVRFYVIYFNAGKKDTIFFLKFDLLKEFKFF